MKREEKYGEKEAREEEKSSMMEEFSSSICFHAFACTRAKEREEKRFVRGRHERKIMEKDMVL